MEKFDNNAEQLYELYRMTEKQVKRYAERVLKDLYTSVKVTSDYVYAKGSPGAPCLVAHMDTVHAKPPKEITATTGGLITGDRGLGADDRNGVFMVLGLVRNVELAVMQARAGRRLSVLLTMGEERGGIGAKAAAAKEDFSNVSFFVEFDRRGSHDAVFYQCETQEFMDYVTSFGFIEECGSFSDISTLMTVANRCGVNLSCGYWNEHTRAETADFYVVETNMRKALELLEDAIATERVFAYEEYKPAPKKYKSSGAWATGASGMRWSMNDYEDWDYSDDWLDDKAKTMCENNPKIAEEDVSLYDSDEVCDLCGGFFNKDDIHWCHEVGEEYDDGWIKLCSECESFAYESGWVDETFQPEEEEVIEAPPQDLKEAVSHALLQHYS